MSFSLPLQEYDPKLRRHRKTWKCHVRMSDKGLANFTRYLVKFHGKIVDSHCLEDASPKGKTGNIMATFLISLPYRVWARFWEESGIRLYYPDRLQIGINPQHPTEKAIASAAQHLFSQVDRKALNLLPTRNYSYNSDGVFLAAKGDYHGATRKLDGYSFLNHFHGDRKRLKRILDGDLEALIQDEREFRHVHRRTYNR